MALKVAKGFQVPASEEHASLSVVDGEGGELRDHRGSQWFVSHLWSTHLAEALPWRTRRAYRFKHPNHINILKGHAHKTLLQLAPLASRLVVFQDSLVTLGSNAKGRSSSLALSRIMRKSLALQIAKDVYTVGFHCPTWAIRADDPSRQKRLRATRLPLPSWLLALKRGEVALAQGALDKCSGTPRSWGRRMLFSQIALLAASGEYRSFSEWSKTQSSTTKPFGLGQGTSHSSHRCVEGSALAEPSARPLPELARWDPIEVATLLEEVQRFPYLKNYLAGPWRLLTTWEGLWPGKVHPPMPAPLLKALVTRNWLRFAMVLLDPPDRLLRAIEALRAHCLESARLFVGYRDRLSATEAGQESDQRCKNAKRPSRCALRSAFSKEVFCSHATRRAHMAFLLGDSSEAPSASVAGSNWTQ